MTAITQMLIINSQMTDWYDSCDILVSRQEPPS